MDLKVPFHPECIAATTFSLSSTKITGTQSAVKIPIIEFSTSVIIASPSEAIISSPFIPSNL